METLCRTTSFVPNSNWIMQQSNSTTEWTKEENKRFESALAIYDEMTPNRWPKVAAIIPGKSVLDVMMHYKELVADVSDIEAGLLPNPRRFASSFTLEYVDNHKIQTFIKRGKSCDQERKKGVPWTEEEHRSIRFINTAVFMSVNEPCCSDFLKMLSHPCQIGQKMDTFRGFARLCDIFEESEQYRRFLMGLEKYGKGDWRNISRNFVISKTPTQVASHAQKYYLRQLSGEKERKRPSIHDITTLHLTNNELLVVNNNNNNNKSTCEVKSYMSPLQRSTSTTDVLIGCWNNSNDGAFVAFGQFV